MKFRVDHSCFQSVSSSLEQEVSGEPGTPPSHPQPGSLVGVQIAVQAQGHAYVCQRKSFNEQICLETLKICQPWLHYSLALQLLQYKFWVCSKIFLKLNENKQNKTKHLPPGHPCRQPLHHGYPSAFPCLYFQQPVARSTTDPGQNSPGAAPSSTQWEPRNKPPVHSPMTFTQWSLTSKTRQSKT